jgi:serine/threonine protein kinase/Tol biopolymer transport system component
MTISQGTKLGRYEIRSKIGEGGMGEVYRATDPKIGRDVAIKVLIADLSSDPERVARFEQEAQAAGALNHPNILAIYDVDTEDGVLYVVSELLDGEELRQRLDEGPIPLRKVTDYAQQIVSGLSAAHEKGIVHRDLKPENLFVTTDDRVKILDFGLAKLREPDTNIHGSEDATRRALTNPGVVMGTVGYMSPEQVRGGAVDHRSDIFSFGVVLYEMLSGNKAFHGDSVVELMNAILKEDVPELVDENRRVPPSFDKLMRRCLEKRPELRFYSAHDLGFALDALSAPTSSSGTSLTTTAKALGDGPAAKSAWPGRLTFAAAALFLLTTVLMSALYLRRVEPRSPTMRFFLPPPEKTSFAEASAISPDGQQVAFITVGATGATSLWVRPLASAEPRQLAGTDGAQFPFWSPDSRFIGFFAGGKLRKVDVAGGPSQTVADASLDPRGATWAPDGTIVFAPNISLPLMRVSASGGPVSEVTTLDTAIGQTSHRWPSLLPDGKHVIYFGRGGQRQGLYVSALDSNDSKFLVPATVTGAYTEAEGKGYLLFVRESTLMAQPFDARRLELSGEAVPIVEGLLSFPNDGGPTAYAAFSASAGHLVYRTGERQTTRLTWFDRSGKALEAVTEPGDFHEPSLSGDAKRLLFGRSEGAGKQDLFLLDLSRGNSTRLTFTPEGEGSSVFSPDDSQVVFNSGRSGDFGDLYRKASSGAGKDELVLNGMKNPYPDSWSRDGKYLVFEADDGPKTKVDLWILPMTGDPKPFSYLSSEFQETHAQFSPDGRWVAYTSDETGRSEVYVQSFPIGGGKWQISTNGGDQAQWRPDGKEIFYLAPDRNLMAVTVSGGTTLDPGRPAELFRTFLPSSGITEDRNNYVPTKDGQRFILNSLAEASNSQPLSLVLNWAADLKK